MVAVNHFSAEQQIRINADMGLNTLCFDGSNNTYEGGVPLNKIGVLITNIQLFQSAH